jgi:PAP2 superfamily
MRRNLPALVAAAVLTIPLTAVSPAAASPGVDGQSVRDWNAIAVATIAAIVPPAPGSVAAPVYPLYLTYVHEAVYDAVDDVSGAAVPAAVAEAAYTVLSHYFPGQQVNLDAAYATALAGIPAQELARGLAVGQAAATDVLAERSGDGLNGPVTPPPPPAPGVWAPADAAFPVAAASWLSSARPFVLDSPSELRPSGPPALTSDRWARDYEEVRTLGFTDSTVRTPVQTEVALFWADPPAVQSQRALRAYSVQEGLDALESARLFALTNTAAADALIACADAKFRYWFWRPITAIPLGDTDTNPDTQPQPGWTSLVPTPNFPEYLSNHSCATTAIATVIDGLGHGFPLTIESWRVPPGSPPGTPPALAATHTFSSANELIDEVANARVWGGLHYRFSTDAGTAIGRAAAELVLDEEG